MAKKRKPKDKPKGKGGKGKGKKTTPKGPRSQALPGMEQVRNRKLDALCESIGEGRDEMNQIRQSEKTSKTAALREMHEKGVEVYKHAGIVLLREPGEETLIVKKAKGEAEESAPAGEDVETTGDAGTDGDDAIGNEHDA